MDKWDKKDQDKDEFMSIIKDALPKYLEQQSKEPTVLHHLSLSLTSEQLKKVSEALSNE